MSVNSPKSRASTKVDKNQKIDTDFLMAKNRFFGATIEMGWQLALIVLIPLIAGIKLDDAMDSSISYTLAGFIIAVAGAAAVVWKTVKDVAKEQADIEQSRKKSTKARKSGSK